MTKIIIENIKDVNDLLMFSSAYQKGTINLNITKIATHLNKNSKKIFR